MTQRIDFSQNASIYDRRHGSELSQDIARELASMGQLSYGGTVLDIGTGLVAIAFAAIGYKTVALDLALPMPARVASQSSQQKSKRLWAMRRGFHSPEEPSMR